MSKTLIDDIVKLTRNGWRPYRAEAQGHVYTALECQRQQKAYWFVRGDVFLCVGCARRCSLSRPEGFSLPLPILYPQPSEPYSLTPLEMVQRKHLLNVYEAAYCLNCSDRVIYRWIDGGELRRVKKNPVRVLAEDVFRMMNNIDE